MLAGEGDIAAVCVQPFTCEKYGSPSAIGFAANDPAARVFVKADTGKRPHQVGLSGVAFAVVESDTFHNTCSVVCPCIKDSAGKTTRATDFGQTVGLFFDPEMQHRQCGIVPIVDADPLSIVRNIVKLFHNVEA